MAAQVKVDNIADLLFKISKLNKEIASKLAQVDKLVKRIELVREYEYVYNPTGTI